MKRSVNLTLLTLTGILIVFGLFMVTSAGMVVSHERFDQSLYFAKNQILKGLLPGLALGLLFFYLPYQYLRRFASLFFFVGAGLLILVYVPGVGLALGGAKRWLHIASINFQPSELFKLAFIIYLAAFLEKRSDPHKKYSLLFPFLVVLIPVAALIGLEPDLGTLGIFILTACAMYFSAQTPLSHIAIIGAIGFSGLALFIKIFPHAIQRVQVLFNPQLDPKGIGYQMNQALIALGSGGIFGQGLAQGKQKFLYLPQPAGDSIAAVIGEELGFIGMLALISLFVAFGLQGYRIAKNAPDEFSRLLAIGLTSLIIIQAFINLTAISGLIPLTGVTLPFISYGGTSLAVSIVAVAILLNISKQTNR